MYVSGDKCQAPHDPYLSGVIHLVHHQIQCPRLIISGAEQRMNNAPLRGRGGIRIAEGAQWQRLKGLMAPFGGILGKLRDQLSPTSVVNVRPLEAVLVPRPWHRGNVAMIGDAVHATTPHLASGAGIAVEDALVLSDFLASESDIGRALERFEERRWERCRMVVENSVAIGEMELNHASPDKLKALMAESESALRADI